MAAARGVFAAAGAHLIEDDGDEIDLAQRVDGSGGLAGGGAAGRFGGVGGGLLTPGNEAECFDGLEDAVLIDGHLAGLEVAHEALFLIAHDEIEQDLAGGGANGGGGMRRLRRLTDGGSEEGDGDRDGACAHGGT